MSPSNHPPQPAGSVTPPEFRIGKGGTTVTVEGADGTSVTQHDVLSVKINGVNYDVVGNGTNSFPQQWQQSESNPNPHQKPKPESKTSSKTLQAKEGNAKKDNSGLSATTVGGFAAITSACFTAEALGGDFSFSDAMLTTTLCCLGASILRGIAAAVFDDNKAGPKNEQDNQNNPQGNAKDKNASPPDENPDNNSSVRNGPASPGHR
jgi:hypothetical protein